jgi:hypothetical protein
MDKETEVMLRITECLEMVHKNQVQQSELNKMVIQSLNVMEQDIQLLKVGFGELKKEVRVCRT